MDEMKKVLHDRTVEHLLKKIDHILDHREETGGHLTHEEVECLKDAWKALWYAHECAK